MLALARSLDLAAMGNDYQLAVSRAVQASMSIQTGTVFATVFILMLLALGMFKFHIERLSQIRLEKQNRDISATLNNLGQAFCLFDAAGRLILFNEPYLRMFGLAANEVHSGCSIRELARLRRRADPCAGITARYTEWILAAISSGRRAGTVMELDDGRIISAVSQPIDGGCWVATHEDVTERHLAERERDRNKALLDAIIENVPATIFVKRAGDGRYLLVNRAGEQFYGIPRHQIIGKTVHEIFTAKTANLLAEHDRRLLQQGDDNPVEERETEIELTGDRLRIANSVRVLLFGQDGKPEYILGVIEDVTERKQSEIRIAHMLRHDMLTNLPNRAALWERLSSALLEAEKNSEPVAVFYIDLNRFERCNDLFGYSTGDKLLAELAFRLKQAADDAFLARYGSDAFVLIQTQAHLPGAAEKLAVALLEASGEEIPIDDCPIRIGASIGIAIYPEDGADPSTLLANAEAALRHAKSDPNGSIRFFKPETDRIVHEQKVLRHDLQFAIPRNEFRLHYQPQALIDGTVTGFEALIRWQHPVRGLLPPAAFIALAEESGLIARLGEWVLREACREAVSWQRPLQISVNLSPIQFRSGNLAQLVRGVLQETNLSPERLELEVTEGTLIDDLSGATALLRQIKSYGVRIAMDDFGTGYSSLSYLQSFPFEKIKIDRAFIANLDHNPHSVAIVRAVIGLGRGLGVGVLAEGVETEVQRLFLCREQCDAIQGHLIGTAAPASEYAWITGTRPAVQEGPAPVAHAGLLRSAGISTIAPTRGAR